MARNMVTRTITGTEVTVKVVDAATEQIVTDTITLGKAFKADDDKLKKAVAKAIPEGKILVSIVDTKEINKCYGMPISAFMEQAVELDPAKRSVLDSGNDEE